MSSSTPSGPTPGARPADRVVRSPGWRPWWRAAAVVVLSALGAASIAANFVRLPYVIISPGDATALDADVVTVSGARTYRHAGELLFLTVRVTNDDPSVWRWLFAQVDGDVRIEPKEEVIGCASYAESARLNDLLMQESQESAKTVALRRLGYDVVEEGSQSVVVGVLCDGPSRGRLMLGDVITAIDGHPISQGDDIRPLVQAHHRGDVVSVSVERDGRARDVTVRAGSRDGAAFLGIVTQTFAIERFPIEVTIDTRRVSGPSAGLAFTLSIIDVLTPGDLTGGKRVAVTGSIEPDGRVGTVGGVEQKAVTARRNGAVLMLVPAGEAKAARAHADGLKVVAVRTVDDALEALAGAGGDPLPAGPSAAMGQ